MDDRRAGLPATYRAVGADDPDDQTAASDL